MNPLLLKIGIGVVVSAAAYFFFVWKNKNKTGLGSSTYRSFTNYDGSNISSCCICLTEFKFLEKSEVIILPCRHKICRKCCKKMFEFQVKNKRNCPQCRQIVPEEVVSLI